MEKFGAELILDLHGCDPGTFTRKSISRYFASISSATGFSGNYPLVGCWLVASQAVGICIREDQNLVTSRDANFIPHVILD